MQVQKILSILLMLALSACSFPIGPTPVSATPSTTPTPVSTPTPSPTLTPSPTPTSTPEPTSTPTQTPTPTITPTPQGFYSNPGGFAFILSPDWKLENDSSSSVSFVNNRDRINLYTFSYAMEDGEGFLQDLIDELLTDFKSSYPDIKERSREETMLGAGIPAQKIYISGKDASRFEIGILFYTAIKNNKEFILLFISSAQTLEMRSLSLQKIIDSVSLDPQPIYGIERSKALVLLGGIPEEDDLDPALGSGSAAGYAGHLFSGLVRLSPQLQIIPDLAESWTTSPDGTVYTFTLRTDLKFQAGNLLTASDVAYSWERAADPETDSPTARTYLGDIVGVMEKLDGEAESISGIQVVDDRTLVVTIDGPKPYFLAKLTYPTAYVVDPKDVEADPETWMFQPNASGPFFIQEYIEDETIIFQRSESYYQPAGLEYVIYLLDRYGDISLFKASEIDITGLSNDDAMLIMDDPEHELYDEFVSATSMCTSMVKFNNQLAPMDDPLVRKAFALAVDRSWFAEEYFDDLHILAQTILPPAMPAYSPDLTFPTFDSAAAMEALKASSYYGSMPKIVMQNMGFAGSVSPYLDALIDMWRENLGITVHIETIEPVAFTEAARKSPRQMVSYSWCADYPDPENFIDLLFHTDRDFNVSTYSSEEVDSLLEQARTELDSTRRMELYQQAEQLLLEDFALIPMLHFVQYSLVNSRVQGYVEVPMGAPIIQLLRLEDTQSGENP